VDGVPVAGQWRATVKTGGSLPGPNCTIDIAEESGKVLCGITVYVEAEQKVRFTRLPQPPAPPRAPTTPAPWARTPQQNGGRTAAKDTAASTLQPDPSTQAGGAGGNGAGGSGAGGSGAGGSGAGLATAPQAAAKTAGAEATPPTSAVAAQTPIATAARDDAAAGPSTTPTPSGASPAPAASGATAASTSGRAPQAHGSKVAQELPQREKGGGGGVRKSPHRPGSPGAVPPPQRPRLGAGEGGEAMADD
jgi:hypothetical protein